MKGIKIYLSEETEYPVYEVAVHFLGYKPIKGGIKKVERFLFVNENDNGVFLTTSSNFDLFNKCPYVHMTPNEFINWGLK